MVTISIQKPVKGIQDSYANGYELALAMRKLYKEKLIQQEALERYFDIKELERDEITDEMLTSIEEAKNTPKHLFSDL